MQESAYGVNANRGWLLAPIQAFRLCVGLPRCGIPFAYGWVLPARKEEEQYLASLPTGRLRVACYGRSLSLFEDAADHVTTVNNEMLAGTE